MAGFAAIPDSIRSGYVSIPDPALRLHYLEAGTGDAVLLVHGWPTSAYLWRNVMPAIARHKRVIALDLPGFGLSDKPPDGSYSFRYYNRALACFLDAMDVDRVDLVVHDLGGPVGLYWAVNHPEAVRSLSLLNTLVYPKPSWAVVAFVAATFLPGLRDYVSSPRGIDFGMKFGVENKARIHGDVIANYQAPFDTSDARRALLRTAQRLSPKGMMEIARALPKLDVPTRIIYGENDRILPDVATTMARVKRDVPHAELTSLPGCGHFLQEDEPEKLGELLAAFLATT